MYLFEEKLRLLLKIQKFYAMKVLTNAYSSTQSMICSYLKRPCLKRDNETILSFEKKTEQIGLKANLEFLSFQLRF